MNWRQDWIIDDERIFGEKLKTFFFQIILFVNYYFSQPLYWPKSVNCMAKSLFNTFGIDDFFFLHMNRIYLRKPKTFPKKKIFKTKIIIIEFFCCFFFLSLFSTLSIIIIDQKSDFYKINKQFIMIINQRLVLDWKCKKNFWREFFIFPSNINVIRQKFRNPS